MTDFLLELRSEEIPARMQEKAQADLARLFAAELEKAGIAASALETFATPRRLALIARDLPGFTAAVSEETKGPRTSAPPQALEGFLRKVGVARHQLVERDGVWFAVVDKPGRATTDVLAEAIPAIIRAFPWPKSMRWGDASASSSALRWVRPLQGIVALLGDEIVPVEIEGIVSGAATFGHRFHHPGQITIGSAHDYAEKLRLCHVIVDPAERRRIIEDGAAAIATANGLAVIPDPGLVAENAGLTEWPVPLLGFFDPGFLEVPREVIQLTLRTNQKYFVLNDAAGRLAPAFVCTANIDAADGGAQIVAGNGKVLAARLSDARFFWEQDLKVRLEEQAKKLSGIVFHEKLGTVADKVERVAKLALWLVETGVIGSSPARGGGPSPGDGGGGSPPATTPTVESPLHHAPHGPPPRGEELADLAEQAARLCKADLVTGMVGEFPELQGIMGGYYARAEGLPDEVVDAIRDHYKPVGQGDDVPSSPVTVAVSLADKLDTVACFFAIDEPPTGSKDPFALRRAIISSERTILEHELRFSFAEAVRSALENIVKLPRVKEDVISLEVAAEQVAQLGFVPTQSIDGAEMLHRGVNRIADQVFAFAIDRLKVQQREAGVRHDLIDAVFALGGEDDLVRLLARVKALQAFVETEDGRNLIAGYKRAANILRKEARDGESVAEYAPLSYTPEKEEAALQAALSLAEARAASAVAAEEFEAAMSALATLRAPIDAFFEAVIVNDPAPEKREARRALLARIRRACHQVADFSQIEG